METHTELSWKTSNGNFGKGSKNRRTFCDDAIDHAKKVPAPGSYDVSGLAKKIPGGKLGQTEGVSYLSDNVIRGMTTPGPEVYNPDPSCIKAKHSASISMRVPSRGLEKSSWRH